MFGTTDDAADFIRDNHAAWRYQANRWFFGPLRGLRAVVRVARPVGRDPSGATLIRLKNEVNKSRPGARRAFWAAVVLGPTLLVKGCNAVLGGIGAAATLPDVDNLQPGIPPPEVQEQYVTRAYETPLPDPQTISGRVALAVRSGTDQQFGSRNEQLEKLAAALGHDLEPTAADHAAARAAAAEPQSREPQPERTTVERTSRDELA